MSFFTNSCDFQDECCHFQCHYFCTLGEHSGHRGHLEGHGSSRKDTLGPSRVRIDVGLVSGSLFLVSTFLDFGANFVLFLYFSVAVLQLTILWCESGRTELEKQAFGMTRFCWFVDRFFCGIGTSSHEWLETVLDFDHFSWLSLGKGAHLKYTLGPAVSFTSTYQYLLRGEDS